MSKVVRTALAVAAGFAAGVLLAPKSGKETREDIKNKALEGKEMADKKAGEVAEVAKKGAAKASAEVKGMAKSARKSAEAVRAEANYLGHEAKERVSRTTDKTKRAAKED